MAIGYVIYNPLAGNGQNAEVTKRLNQISNDQLQYFDMTRITNYKAFLGGLEKDDYLIIAGGDGTLNRFVNATEDIEVTQEILYLPAGTGNDFAKDLGNEDWDKPMAITPYLKNLPGVEVKGKQYRFLNGVGFGIDGYCCQVGDELKKVLGKRVDYTGIAVKGILLHFTPRNARVTVDGKEYSYQKVWITPTMHGHYYGGGMIPAPRQNRASGTLSVMLFHGAGRLRTLCVFPGIFKGTHVKHENMVAVHTGHEITVEFDRPTPLQIDGETILDVTRYTARAASYDVKPAKVFATV